jgi:NAD(P)H-nitrite reductase large subunit
LKFNRLPSPALAVRPLVPEVHEAAAIGAQLKAGTNCGSCIPELKRLIAQTVAVAVVVDKQRQLSAAG